jgi:predicted SPOUT superfamily RNA methylase MTH1
MKAKRERIMRIPSFSIAIPASIISDVPGLQLKTYKIGQVARASAIYRVDHIFVYPDQDHRRQLREIEFISQVLSYTETPQYLRKRIFPLSPMLKYAGALPPLNTPHHPTNSLIATLRDGEFREGVVLSSDKDGSLVDIGMERPLRYRGRLKEGRMTFRVRKYGNKELKLELADPSDVPEYWGYKVVELSQPLGQFMRTKTHDVSILTSRLGSRIGNIMWEMKNKLQKSTKILIAFGSPKEGLREILAREGLDQSIADYNLNTIPNQGTVSIRTEEAIHATLSIMNLLIQT